MTRERSRGLARGCASPPDRYQGSAKIFHDVFPVFFFSSGRGTRGGSRDFPLRVFPHVSVARCRGAVAGPGMSGAGGRIPPGSLSMLLPSAGLFQRLIIYRRLCGQLYRGSYCLIELLDSSAAKTGTGAGKKKKGSPHPSLSGSPGSTDSTIPWERSGFPEEIWGAATLIPPCSRLREAPGSGARAGVLQGGDTRWQCPAEGVPASICRVSHSWKPG